MKRPLSWVINEVSDLPLYAFGQVAILGDAVRVILHTSYRRLYD